MSEYIKKSSPDEAFGPIKPKVEDIVTPPVVKPQAPSHPAPISPAPSPTPRPSNSSESPCSNPSCNQCSSLRPISPLLSRRQAIGIFVGFAGFGLFANCVAINWKTVPEAKPALPKPTNPPIPTRMPTVPAVAAKPAETRPTIISPTATAKTEAPALIIPNRHIPELEKEVSRIFNTDFLGPEAIEQTFGKGINLTDIPSVPFEPKVMERAKELNLFLIFRASHLADKTGLTMENMDQVMKPRMAAAKQGLPLHPQITDSRLAGGAGFYSQETPKKGWALVGKEAISDSVIKTYAAQTSVLRDSVYRFFNRMDIPENIAPALEEVKIHNQNDYSKMEWMAYTQLLAEMKINQMFRHSPASAMYDLLVYFSNRNERLLRHQLTRTTGRKGGIVAFGAFGDGGMNITIDHPDFKGPEKGVVFSWNG